MPKTPTITVKDPAEAVRTVLQIITMLPPTVQKLLFQQLEAQGVFKEHGYRLFRRIRREEAPPGAVEAIREGSEGYIRAFLGEATRGDDGIIVVDTLGTIAAETLEELETLGVGVEVGRSIQQKARNRKAKNTKRDTMIVELHDNKHFTFGQIPVKLRSINPKWVRKDGELLERDTVEKAYHREKKRGG